MASFFRNSWSIYDFLLQKKNPYLKYGRGCVFSTLQLIIKYSPIKQEILSIGNEVMHNMFANEGLGVYYVSLCQMESHKVFW